MLAAGERPGKRGPSSGINVGAIVRLVRNVVLVLIVVGAIAYGVFPPFRNAIDDRVNTAVQTVTGTVSRPTLVHTTSVQASASIAGHGAAAAVDAFSNTYWAAPVSQGAHPVLTLGFASGTNISVVLFISGDAANFAAEPRPKEVQLTFSNGTKQTLTLADSAKPQQFDIDGATGITGLTVEIASVYPAASGKAVSLSDLEFFGNH